MLPTTSDFLQCWFKRIKNSGYFYSEKQQNITFEKILFLPNETTEKCSNRIFHQEIFTGIEIIMDLQQEEN